MVINRKQETLIKECKKLLSESNSICQQLADNLTEILIKNEYIKNIEENIDILSKVINIDTTVQLIKENNLDHAVLFNSKNLVVNGTSYEQLEEAYLIVCDLALGGNGLLYAKTKGLCHSVDDIINIVKKETGGCGCVDVGKFILNKVKEGYEDE